MLHKIHWSVDSGLGPTPKAFSWKISSPSSKSRSATKYLKKSGFFYKCKLVIWKVTNLPIKDVDLMPNAEEYASSNFSCLNIRLFSISHAELFSSFESMFFGTLPIDEKKNFANNFLSEVKKCRIWIFAFWHFPPIFVLLKLTCLVTLFDRKLQVLKNSSKWTIFGIFK